MKNLSKTQFYLAFLGLLSILFLLFSLTFELKFPLDYYEGHSYGTTLEYGAFHITTNIIFFVAAVISIIVFMIDWSDDCEIYKKYKKMNEKDKTKVETKMETKDKTITKNKFTWKKGIITGLLLYLLVILFNFGVDNFKKGAKMYNTSKIYNNAYTQKVQEKKGFYDKLWKTYLQKEKITNINKETFLQVTKMIMENRADGKNLTWKWLQENQQISYEQFSKFYTDLSDFITSQREGYFGIEKECQLIAYQNNTLLDTFPNNLYNKILNLKRIDFEYGFTSDSTEVVFKNKKENLTK